MECLLLQLQATRKIDACVSRYVQRRLYSELYIRTDGGPAGMTCNNRTCVGRPCRAPNEAANWDHEGHEAMRRPRGHRPGRSFIQARTFVQGTNPKLNTVYLLNPQFQDHQYRFP